jgi:phage baseplate assembly protein W
MRFPDAIGFPLLPVPDANGRLAWPSAEASVRERIECLLLTRPGELIGHRRVGVGLRDFFGQPDTLATRRSIHDRIVAQLAANEPRIVVDRVEVFGHDTEVAGDFTRIAIEPGQLRIEVHYRLRRTGAVASVGVTVALQETGD